MDLLLQVFMILIISSSIQCQGTPGIYLSTAFHLNHISSSISVFLLNIY